MPWFHKFLRDATTGLVTGVQKRLPGVLQERQQVREQVREEERAQRRQQEKWRTEYEQAGAGYDALVASGVADEGALATAGARLAGAARVAGQDPSDRLARGQARIDALQLAAEEEEREEEEAQVRKYLEESLDDLTQTIHASALTLPTESQKELYIAHLSRMYPEAGEQSLQRMYQQRVIDPIHNEFREAVRKGDSAVVTQAEEIAGAIGLPASDSTFTLVKKIRESAAAAKVGDAAAKHRESLYRLAPTMPAAAYEGFAEIEDEEGMALALEYARELDASPKLGPYQKWIEDWNTATRTQGNTEEGRNAAMAFRVRPTDTSEILQYRYRVASGGLNPLTPDEARTLAEFDDPNNWAWRVVPHPADPTDASLNIRLDSAENVSRYAHALAEEAGIHKVNVPLAAIQLGSMVLEAETVAQQFPNDPAFQEVPAKLRGTGRGSLYYEITRLAPNPAIQQKLWMETVDFLRREGVAFPATIPMPSMAPIVPARDPKAGASAKVPVTLDPRRPPTSTSLNPTPRRQPSGLQLQE